MRFRYCIIVVIIVLCFFLNRNITYCRSDDSKHFGLYRLCQSIATIVLNRCLIKDYLLTYLICKNTFWDIPMDLTLSYSGNLKNKQVKRYVILDTARWQQWYKENQENKLLQKSKTECFHLFCSFSCGWTTVASWACWPSISTASYLPSSYYRYCRYAIYYWLNFCISKQWFFFISANGWTPNGPSSDRDWDIKIDIWK